MLPANEKSFTMPRFEGAQSQIRYRHRSVLERESLVRAKLKEMASANRKHEEIRRRLHEENSVGVLIYKIGRLISSPHTDVGILEIFFKQNGSNLNLYTAVLKLIEQEHDAQVMGNLLSLVLLMVKAEEQPAFLIDLLNNESSSEFRNKLLEKIYGREGISDEYVENFISYCVNNINHMNVTDDFYTILLNINGKSSPEASFRDLEAKAKAMLVDLRGDYYRLATTGYQYDDQGYLIVEAKEQEIREREQNMMNLNRFLINLYGVSKEHIKLDDIKSFIATNTEYDDLPQIVKLDFQCLLRPFNERSLNLAFDLLHDRSTQGLQAFSAENIRNYLLELIYRNNSRYINRFTQKLALDTLLKINPGNTNAICERLLSGDDFNSVYLGFLVHTDLKKVAQLTVQDWSTNPESIPKVLFLALLAMTQQCNLSERGMSSEFLDNLAHRSRELMLEVLDSGPVNLASLVLLLSSSDYPNGLDRGIISGTIPGQRPSLLQIFNSIVPLFDHSHDLPRNRNIVKLLTHPEILEELGANTVRTIIDSPIARSMSEMQEEIEQIRATLDGRERNLQQFVVSYERKKRVLAKKLLQDIENRAMSIDELRTYYSANFDDEDVYSHNDEISGAAKSIDLNNEIACNNLVKLVLIACEKDPSRIVKFYRIKRFQNKLLEILAGRTLIAQEGLEAMLVNHLDNYKIRDFDHFAYDRCNDLAQIIFPGEPAKALKFMQDYLLQELDHAQNRYITAMQAKSGDADALVFRDGEVDTTQINLPFFVDQDPETNDPRVHLFHIQNLINHLLVSYTCFPDYIKAEDLLFLYDKVDSQSDVPRGINIPLFGSQRTSLFNEIYYKELNDLVLWFVKNKPDLFPALKFKKKLAERIFSSERSPEAELKRGLCIDTYKNIADKSHFDQLITSMLAHKDVILKTWGLKYCRSVSQCARLVTTELEQEKVPIFLALTILDAIEKSPDVLMESLSQLDKPSKLRTALSKLDLVRIPKIEYGKLKPYRGLQAPKPKPCLEYLMKFAQDNPGTKAAVNIYEALSDYKLLKQVDHLAIGL